MTKTLLKKDERSNEIKPRPKRQTSTDTNTTVVGNNKDSYLNGIGPYEFIKPLGSGKFSKVMLAHHLETHQQVAIKVIMYSALSIYICIDNRIRSSINKRMITELCQD